MARTRSVRRYALPAVASVLALSLAGCGGNLGSTGGEEAAESFPTGPITLTIGQDPGGSTDLIGRALAEVASEELGVPMPVVNKPGANGALAAQELATQAPDGQHIMVINASLISITPLAVPEDEAIDITDYEVVTGISQDDYVLVANPASGYATVEDLVAATEPVDYGTTGVGTGSQLSQELLFKQAGIEGTAIPFDGGSPALTAVLGNQVDVASVQLGEAIGQIQAGAVTPIVTFSTERNPYLPDTPTAVEAGYDVPVAQYRAIAAPKGTPAPVLDRLRQAFTAAFESPQYQEFNTQNLLTPHEIDGAQVIEEWTSALEKYRGVVAEYGIQMGDTE
jgi:tripartite-type tricarboxylate transporter receptor subunit TctC